ncbi:unnamed protein product [Vitrella brassicaformis CCMP3155]|uniref:EGF-like calcium-binding domain-containing protein n=1 Tax=Vitrella brassicaformis (strain CCMP3155) TaxID=1169540 RepID=A0A0G4EN61_VITBC|nr:unnamed protein product [Vitrella brassicaformis CCMP3155]|eukprot:CEL98271.1 unnamed protein product [Vitrella brassicaformis CCMP3155]
MLGVIAALAAAIGTAGNPVVAKYNTVYESPSSGPCICDGDCPPSGYHFTYSSDIFLNQSIPLNDLAARRQECARLCLAHPICSMYEVALGLERRCEVHYGPKSLPRAANSSSGEAECILRKDSQMDGGPSKPGACRCSTCGEGQQSGAYKLMPISPPSDIADLSNLYRRRDCSIHCFHDRQCTGIEITLHPAEPGCKIFYSLMDSYDEAATDRECFPKTGLPVPTIVNSPELYQDVPVVATIDFGESVVPGPAVDGRELDFTDMWAQNGTVLDVRLVDGSDSAYNVSIVPPNASLSLDNKTYITLTVPEGVMQDVLGQPNPVMNFTLPFYVHPILVNLTSSKRSWHSPPVEVEITFDTPVVFNRDRPKDDIYMRMVPYNRSLANTGVTLESWRQTKVFTDPETGPVRRVTMEVMPTASARIALAVPYYAVTDASVPYRGNYVASMTLDYGLPGPSLVDPFEHYHDVPIVIEIDFGETVRPGPGATGGGGEVTPKDVNITNGTVTEIRPTGPATYEVTIVPDEPTGDDNTTTVTVTLPSGIVEDERATPNPEREFIITYVRPLGVVLSSSQTLWRSLPIQLTLTFDKRVTDFSVSDLVFTVVPHDSSLTGSVVTSNLRTEPSSGGAISKAMLDLSPTVEGNISVSLPALSVFDSAVPYRGNEAAHLHLEYKSDAPTAVVYMASGSNLTTASPFTVEISFSKRVTVTSLAALEVANGEIVSAGLRSVTDNSYEFDVAPLQETITIVAKEGLAVDVYNQPNEASLPLVVTFDYLKAPQAIEWITRPTLSASSPFNTATFDIYITFSNPITATDFSDHFLIDSMPTTATRLDRNSPTSYTAALRVPVDKTDGGTVQAQLDAGAVQDTDGLTNLASNTITVLYDPIPPEITMYSSAAPRTRNRAFNIDMVLSEPVQPFTEEVFSLSNARIVSMSDNPSQDNAKILQVKAISEGMVEVTVPVGSITDMAGNKNHRIAAFEIPYDITAPSVMLDSSTIVVTEETITVTVTVSETSEIFCQPLTPSDTATHTPQDFDLVNEPPTTSVSPMQQRAAVSEFDHFTAEFVFTGLLSNTMYTISCIAIDEGGTVTDQASREWVQTTEIIPPRVLVPDNNDTVVISRDGHVLTLHFSEAVRDINTDRILLSNALLVEATIRQQLYLDLVLQVPSQGRVTVTLNEGTVKDSYGSGNIFYSYHGLFYDLDECASGTHNCEGTCENTLGGFTCGCASNARLDKDSQTCIVQATVESVDVSRKPHVGFQLSVTLTGSGLSPGDELMLFPLASDSPQAHSSSLLRLMETNVVNQFYLLPCIASGNTTLSCGPFGFTNEHGYVVALCHEEWISLSTSAPLLAATPDATLAGQLSINGAEVSSSAACQSLSVLLTDPSALMQEIVTPGPQPLVNPSDPLSVTAFTPTTLNEAEEQVIRVSVDGFEMTHDQLKIAGCGSCATSKGFPMYCTPAEAANTITCSTIVHRIAPLLCLCECDASLTLEGDCLAGHNFFPAKRADGNTFTFAISQKKGFVSAVEYVEQRHPPHTASSLQLTVRGHHLDPDRDKLMLIGTSVGHHGEFECGSALHKLPSSSPSYPIECNGEGSHTEELFCESVELPVAGTFKACLCDATHKASCSNSTDYSIEPAVGPFVQVHPGWM